MEVKLKVLTAAAACDIATDKHVIKVFKQIKKAMRGIHYRAKHGYFNIKYIDMDKDVQQYLKSIGYDVKTYIDIDDDYITLIQWDRREDNAENTRGTSGNAI
jgi:hypothetical protein